MPGLTVLTTSSGPVATLRVVTSPLARLRGLIGTTALGPDEGLLIPRCRQVHTFGMSYAIDAVFCDRDGVVVGVHTLAPRRISRLVWRARTCVELQAGRARACGIDIGTRLEMQS